MLSRALPALLGLSLCACRVLGGPALTCLNEKCGGAMIACKLDSACRGAATCMEKCSTTSCDSDCLSDAAEGASTIGAAAIAVLSMDGGANGCFGGSMALSATATGSDHCVCTGPCPKYGLWECVYANGTNDNKYKYGDKADCVKACHSAPVAIPGPHDLMCDFFNDTAMMNRLQNLSCALLPSGPWDLGTKACNFTIRRMWAHEASEENCPGFPAPWDPLAPVWRAVDKLFCWGLEREKDEEKKVASYACGNESWLEREVCDETVKVVWDRMLTRCNITSTLPADDVLV